LYTDFQQRDRDRVLLKAQLFAQLAELQQNKINAGEDGDIAEITDAAIQQIFNTFLKNSISLSGITLPGLLLDEAEFDGIQILDAGLYDFMSVGSTFNTANFKSTSFFKAFVSATDFNHSNLNATWWSSSMIKNSEFISTSMTDASIKESHFDEVEFNHSNLARSDLLLTRMRGCEFTGTSFVGTKFRHSVLNFNSFDQADFTDASFHNTDIGGSNFAKSNINQQQVDQACTHNKVVDPILPEGINWHGRECKQNKFWTPEKFTWQWNPSN
jgi:uncharacterized protein YjbI with pentapeptide repeats